MESSSCWCTEWFSFDSNLRRVNFWIFGGNIKVKLTMMYAFSLRNFKNLSRHAKQQSSTFRTIFKMRFWEPFILVWSHLSIALIILTTAIIKEPSATEPKLYLNVRHRETPKGNHGTFWWRHQRFIRMRKIYEPSFRRSSTKSRRPQLL